MAKFDKICFKMMMQFLMMPLLYGFFLNIKTFIFNLYFMFSGNINSDVRNLKTPGYCKGLKKSTTIYH